MVRLQQHPNDKCVEIYKSMLSKLSHAPDYGDRRISNKYKCLTIKAYIFSSQHTPYTKFEVSATNVEKGKFPTLTTQSKYCKFSLPKAFYPLLICKYTMQSICLVFNVVLSIAICRTHIWWLQIKFILY